jgi:glycosyltransferase involved in cell wall biosynthesis
MRIGLIAPQFPPAIGGMQELAFGFATELATHDDITVFTLPGNVGAPGTFAVKPVLSKKDLSANLRVLDADEPNIDAWCAMDAGLAPLAPLLSRPFFNYFHGNDLLTPGYGYPGEWGEWLKDKPIVWRFARRVKRVGRRRLMRRSLPAVREIFTNSRSTARVIERTYPGHGRPVTVIPPGVAEPFFQQRDAAAARDRLRLLTVSRLTRQARRKNVEGILGALRLLKSRKPSLPFAYTIVGDGDDRERLSAMAEAFGLAPEVTFAGFVARDELLEILRRTDLFVLVPKATVYDIEGFGIVYIEASASGVPVLGSAEGGATDAIEDGTNGILIPASDPASIAAGIERFQSMRDSLQADRVRAFAERFRWPDVSARLRSRIAFQVESSLSPLSSG